MNVVYAWLYSNSVSVLSLVYIKKRHVGPTTLQCRIFFDVGISKCAYKLHPNHVLISCLELLLGENTDHVLERFPLHWGFIQTFFCFSRLCVASRQVPGVDRAAEEWTDSFSSSSCSDSYNCSINYFLSL